MQPALFISHGAPTLPFEDVAARTFLRSLGADLARPAAILVVSAHWETAVPTVNAVTHNDTIHDFHGFPRALYRLRYPAPGAPALASRIAALLEREGMPAAIDRTRGLDHGAWVPLSLMLPAHDVPVLQLSVQSRLGPAHHFRLGRALSALRAENVLILASGSMTHDLSGLHAVSVAHEPSWVRDFAEWCHAALIAGRIDDLCDYRRLAPHAVRNHPTEEHLLPLFVAFGAAGSEAHVERLHESITYGVLRMDAYAFR